MMYGLLADLVVAIHIAYVSYVIFGELAILLGIVFKWGWIRNPWFRWTHLLAIVIVAVEAIVGITCPLTDWEHALRRWAGQKTSDVSFIGRFLDNVLFYEAPEGLLTACYIGFALLVLATFWLAPPRRKQRPASAGASNTNIV
jgi:hypothetical protein